jgi:hypothetical protein
MEDENNKEAPKTQDVSWTASEFIAHEKSFSWYAALFAVGIIAAIGIFAITRDAVSVAVVVVSAALLGIYGSRRPRQLEYRVDDSGLTIGEKRYGYDEFRSFAVVPEGAFSSIIFMPLRRFALPTTIYYAPNVEEDIVNILSVSLPLQEHKHDAVDRLMRRIRF